MEENLLVNSTLLQLKYGRIIELLAKKLDVQLPQAMDVFYTSQLYEDLSNPDNHLHNMSDLYLADSIMLELQQK